MRPFHRKEATHRSSRFGWPAFAAVLFGTMVGPPSLAWAQAESNPSSTDSTQTSVVKEEAPTLKRRDA
ncbi:MAG: hypothetical protein AAF449_17770, partial [Myxococcota bacterium]